MRADRSALVSLAAVSLVLLGIRTGGAACDPTRDPDKTDVANARTAVARACSCTGTSRQTYLRCSADTLTTSLTNHDCEGVAQRCAKRSTCGRPGFVTCCRTNTRGDTRCAIRRSAAACTAPKDGTACSTGPESCCDACTATGCASTSTTTSTTMRGPPCGFDCRGMLCPPGEGGVILRSRCGCAPLPACGSSSGVCGGNCPAGTEGCHFDTFNNCCLCGGP